MDEVVNRALYHILQGMSGCKYLYDWCIDGSIQAYSHLYGIQFTPEQRAELDAALRDGLVKIGYKQRTPEYGPHPVHEVRQELQGLPGEVS